MKPPSISVLLTTYKRAHLVPRAVRSVLSQTDGEWQLVVVDDASPDDTAAALEPFKADPRVKIVVNAVNRGNSVARNRALAEADGEWIVWLDDDDELLPTYIERLRALIAARPEIGLTWSGAERVFHGAPTTTDTLLWHESWNGVEPTDHAPLQHFSLCWGAAARLDRVRAAGGFDERFVGTGDIDLALRMVAGGTPYASIPEVLVRVHIGEGASVSRARKHYSALRLLMLEKNAAFLAANPALQAHYRRHAMSGCYRDGDKSGGRKMAAALLRSGRLGIRGVEMLLRFEVTGALKSLFHGTPPAQA
jgi:glycosyltransferase involved in cell wall biosynthesis